MQLLPKTKLKCNRDQRIILIYKNSDLILSCVTVCVLYIGLCLLVFIKWSGWARIGIEVGFSMKLDLFCSGYNILFYSEVVPRQGFESGSDNLLAM